MPDERAKAIERIERIAEMLTDIREDSLEEVKGKLEVHFKDLEANLKGYIAECIDRHRAFTVELLMRPYAYWKIEHGVYLLDYDVEETGIGVTEMLEDILNTIHTVLEQRHNS